VGKIVLVHYRSAGKVIKTGKKKNAAIGGVGMKKMDQGVTISGKSLHIKEEKEGGSDIVIPVRPI